MYLSLSLSLSLSSSLYLSSWLSFCWSGHVFLWPQSILQGFGLVWKAGRLWIQHNDSVTKVGLELLGQLKTNMQVICPECGENVGAKDKLPKHLKALFWVSMNTSGGGDVRIGISESNVMISHTSPNILILKITKMLSTPKTTPQKMISQCKCPLWSNILGCKSSLTITHVNAFTQSLPFSSAYQINIVES